MQMPISVVHMLCVTFLLSWLSLSYPQVLATDWNTSCFKFWQMTCQIISVAILQLRMPPGNCLYWEIAGSCYCTFLMTKTIVLSFQWLYCWIIYHVPKGAREVLGGGTPSKITFYMLRSNCTKFGALNCRVTILTKFWYNRPDY